MNNNIINNFIKKQKKAKVSNSEIEQAVFWAVNVAIVETLKELKNNKSKNARELNQKILKEGKQIFEQSTIDKYGKEIINDKNETLNDVLNRHLKNFLDQL